MTNRKKKESMNIEDVTHKHDSYEKVKIAQKQKRI